jgi:hypothetical protein
MTINYRRPDDPTFAPIPVLNTAEGLRIANEAGLLLLGVTHLPIHAPESPCLPVCRGLGADYHAGILWAPGFNR